MVVVVVVVVKGVMCNEFTYQYPNAIMFVLYYVLMDFNKIYSHYVWNNL